MKSGSVNPSSSIWWQQQVARRASEDSSHVDAIWTASMPRSRTRISPIREKRNGRIAFAEKTKSATFVPVVTDDKFNGAVAQLGERCVRNAEVEGSTPFRSTKKGLAHKYCVQGLLFGSLAFQTRQLPPIHPAFSSYSAGHRVAVSTMLAASSQWPDQPRETSRFFPDVEPAAPNESS